jgi:hypothetical protein
MLIQQKEKEKFFARLTQAAKTNPAVLEASPEGYRERIKLMPIDCFIDSIRNLPDRVMEHDHGIRLSFNEQSADDEFFGLVRKQYRAIADWLEFYLLDKADLATELKLTDKADYKPMAEILLAYYRLAQETFLLCGNLQEYLGQPAMISLLIEWERCENLLRNSGFIDNLKPKGKVEAYKDIKAVCNELWDAEKLKSSEERMTIYSPTMILINEAASLSSRPENIKFRHHYQDFLKTLKRCKAQIRDSSLVEIVYLENDTLKALSNGCRGKDKKSAVMVSGSFRHEL